MYKINVARFGYHVFTADCSQCCSREKAERVYQMICERFPEPEFGIALTYWETRGEELLERPLAAPRRNSNEV